MLHMLLRSALLGMLAISGAVAETVVIEADSYLDVVAGRIVSPAIIVVEGDRIVAVNPAERPAGARTIDLGRHTILPGLMDAHTHLNYDFVEGLGNGGGPLFDRRVCAPGRAER